MSKDEDTNTVIDILRNFSFSAVKIPESPKEGKRADIKAEKEGDHFLIEVKTRPSCIKVRYRKSSTF